MNKEIKLSDLFRRRAKEPSEETETPAPKAEKPKRERRALFSRGGGEKQAKEPKEKKPRRTKERAPKAPKEPRERRGLRGKAPAVAAKDAPAVPQIPLMRAFNLMPKEEAREKGTGVGLRQIAVAVLGVLVLAGLAGGYLFMGAGVTSRQGELDDLRAQLAELEVPAEKPDSGAALASDSQVRTTALSAALTTRVAWDRILREFSLVLPEDVWLTQIAGSTPNAAAATGAAVPAPGTAAAAANSISIAGVADSQKTVALLLSRLATIPEFVTVELQSSARGESAYTFAILASIDPLGVPAS